MRPRTVAFIRLALRGALATAFHRVHRLCGYWLHRSADVVNKWWHGASPDMSGYVPDRDRSWITCAVDEQEHAVSDVAFWPVGPGLRADCGHIVVPAALCVPPGPTCTRCRILGVHPGMR